MSFNIFSFLFGFKLSSLFFFLFFFFLPEYFAWQNCDKNIEIILLNKKMDRPFGDWTIHFSFQNILLQKNQDKQEDRRRMLLYPPDLI